MLLLRSIKESKGGVSKFLKTLSFSFLEFNSYKCRYLEMAFCTHFLVYFVVMILTALFDVLAMFDMLEIYSSWGCLGGGGSGI